MWLGDLDGADQAVTEGLAREPGLAMLETNRREIDERRAEASSAGQPGIFGPDAMARLAADPQTRGLLADPGFVAMVTDVQRNPNNMSLYLKDPRFMKAVGAVLGINLSAMGGADGDVEMKEPSPAAAAAAAAASSAGGKKKAEEESKKKAEEVVPEEELTEEEREARAAKAKATAEKDQGNVHFKKREFAEAAERYRAAIALCPSDMSFHSNLAAVHLETGALEECITVCQRAIEVGRANRADYALVGKAFDRMGKAYLKLDRLDEAIEAFKKSLAENRAADVLTRLRDTEKLKKERDEKAYQDPVKSAEAKALGDERFKANDFPAAIKHYEEAILRNPADAKLYSNRAACYQKLGAHPEAVKDCNKAIAIDPNFARAYSRKGTSLYFMKELKQSLDAFKAGLAIDPENQELRDGLQKTAAAINQANSEKDPDQRASEAMRDPEIAEIMQDPVMRMVLQQMQEDPKAAREHLKNKIIADKIDKLIAAGVLRVG
jgi:stress-induced-phosphoprotein 1